MKQDRLEKIENLDVQKLARLRFEGEIFVIDSFKKFNSIIPMLALENTFGFDTETRPSFKKGRTNKVSLLRLSTTEKPYIFRLNKIGIPPGLIKILSDSKIKKIGLALNDDLVQLKKIKKINNEGFIDLQKLAGINGIGELGLKKMAAIVLKGRISKSEQLSNWERDNLTVKQQNYAATDAWACLAIYQKLQNK